MNCPKLPLCYFYKRKTLQPVSDPSYRQYVQRFCENKGKDCAIYLVMDILGFLKTPKDLHPDQMARAHQLIGK